MALDNAANFCYGQVTVAPSPAASGTTMEVTLLGGPTLPAAPWNAVVWITGVGPLQSNAEIVRVTGFTQLGAVVTVSAMTRAQESTSARTIVVGDQFQLGPTAKLIADINALGSGDVVGPAGATGGNFALFDGNTGKLIEDGGTPGSAAFADTGDFDPAGSAAAAQAASQPLDADLTSLAGGTIGASLTFAANVALLFNAALSDQQYCGFATAGTAGATLAFGELCYLQPSDSRWEKVDADAAATSGDVKIGMCVLAAAADGDPTRMLEIGYIRADSLFPTFTISAPVYAGVTPGEVQVAQPSGTDDVIRIMGHGKTADVLWFNPSNDWMTHV